METWQLLTAASVLGLSTSVLLQRVLLRDKKTDPFAYAVIFQGLVGVLLMAVALVVGFKLPGIEAVWAPALLSVVLYAFGHIAYAKTLQRVEASAFAVLFATQAVWIMALGIILFNESLTLLQVIGTALIFAAVLLLVKNLRSLRLDSGTLYGLLSGLLFGVAITAWSHVGRHTDTLSWAAISFLVTAIFTFFIRPSSRHNFAPLLKRVMLTRLTVMAIFYGLGSLAMLYAYKEGTFTVVTPLRQTGIIVTTLLALAFLPVERNRIARKIAAAIICLTGVLLIVT
ncbi:DMT family transporter [Candidatus Saccharibacteria bacterium]|nr:DMT family transporter [Candidatus Saccharibacteria bacterium]